MHIIVLLLLFLCFLHFGYIFGSRNRRPLNDFFLLNEKFWLQAISFSISREILSNAIYWKTFANLTIRNGKHQVAIDAIIFIRCWWSISLFPSSWWNQRVHLIKATTKKSKKSEQSNRWYPENFCDFWVNFYTYFYIALCGSHSHSFEIHFHFHHINFLVHFWLDGFCIKFDYGMYIYGVWSVWFQWSLTKYQSWKKTLLFKKENVRRYEAKVNCWTHHPSPKQHFHSIWTKNVCEVNNEVCVHLIRYVLCDLYWRLYFIYCICFCA